MDPNTKDLIATYSVVATACSGIFAGIGILSLLSGGHSIGGSRVVLSSRPSFVWLRSIGILLLGVAYFVITNWGWMVGGPILWIAGPILLVTCARHIPRKSPDSPQLSREQHDTSSGPSIPQI